MNQNFPLMEFLETKLFRIKNLTTREESEFRLKCNVGDLMYFHVNARTKNSRKVGIGLVINRSTWNIDQLPVEFPKPNSKTFIFPALTWKQFVLMEGFDDQDDFNANYQKMYSYFKDRNKERWITYWFEESTKDLRCKSRILPNRDCMRTPNVVNCTFNQVNEKDCPSFSVDCEICKKEVKSFHNPFDDLIICETCFKKRTVYYSKKNKKESLNLRDLKKIFGFLRSEKKEVKYKAKNLGDFIG
jgi:hypothetical protein